MERNEIVPEHFVKGEPNILLRIVVKGVLYSWVVKKEVKLIQKRKKRGEKGIKSIEFVEALGNQLNVARSFDIDDINTVRTSQGFLLILSRQ